MKKILLIILAAVCFTALIGCQKNAGEEFVHDGEADIPYMLEGEVLSVSSTSITVRTEAYDKIVVSTRFLEGYGYKSDISNIKTGDRVRVLYDGKVAESFPPQILSAYQIYSIE